MKITPKFLSIPPYISTNWNQIHTIYMKGNELIIRLADGATITIPDLKPQEIDTIFAAHSAFGENPHPAPVSGHAPQQFLHIVSNQQTPGSNPIQNPEGMAQMHLNLDSMESFTSAMQHNAEQAHMPNLPKEVLNKIAAIAKIVAPGEIQNIPKPEPHCNCPHCQIARAIHEMSEKVPEESGSAQIAEEEIVNEKDLAFQQWEITETGDKLYSVANRLDTQEKYNVYLGNPVGCTCGIPGCEHILAVLKS